MRSRASLQVVLAAALLAAGAASAQDAYWDGVFRALAQTEDWKADKIQQD